ncbi:hypothetical protein REPUB_Repub10bG0075700 [Reevesia pubescens]
MVDDPATNAIVSWSPTSNSFVVWNPPEFARDFLPKYFKHNNFSSFGNDDIPKEIPDPDAKKIGMMKMMNRHLQQFPTLSTRVHGIQRSPNYKGKWKVPMIDNPDFKDDPDLYVFPKLKYVGIELWQVKSGTLFDNVLVTDDVEHAKKLAEDTWGKQKDAEKAAFEEVEKKK